MSAAAALLDRLGRPGGVRLGAAHPETTPRLATGLPVLDEALGGGLPRGRVTELAGARSGGRTGLACAIAAGATRAGETIAGVDVDDALDPETADAAGVALARTLWVRPRSAADALRATDILLRAGGFGLVVLDLGDGASSRRAVTQPTPATTLLVVTPRPQGGPFVALALEVAGRRARWSGGNGRLVLLDGIDARVTVTRSRVGRPGRTLVVRQASAG